jgi:AraC-like DNA-binding protein
VEAAQAEWTTRRPALPVGRFVDRYVGYRLLGFPAGVHRGLPSPNLTFIVGIGGDIDVILQPDRRQAPDRYRGVLGGLHGAPALIAHDGNQEGVAIGLTPLGVRALLGMPAGALWNTTVELGEVLGSIGTELWERLQPTTSWGDRFARCDEVLGRRVRADHLVVPELCEAWRILVDTAGTATVSDVAGEVGWSRQHFTRRFGEEFGLSPKLAARVIRFGRARRMLAATPSFISLAQVAASCGYFDQAHMTRDFVELAGCPPGRLLADEVLPIFQDKPHPERA